MVPSVRNAAEAHRHLQSLAAWRWGAIASAVMSLALLAAGLLVPAAAVIGVGAAVILGTGAEVARTSSSTSGPCARTSWRRPSSPARGAGW